MKIDNNKNNLQVQCNPLQNSNDLPHRTRKKSPTFHMEIQGKAIGVLHRKNGARGFTFHELNIYSEVILTKTAWFWHKGGTELLWDNLCVHSEDVPLISHLLIGLITS